MISLLLKEKIIIKKFIKTNQQGNRKTLFSKEIRLSR